MRLVLPVANAASLASAGSGRPLVDPAGTASIESSHPEDSEVTRLPGEPAEATEREKLPAQISQSIRSIFQDRRGNLWLGTSGGVVRFDGARFANFARDGRFSEMGDPSPDPWTGPTGDSRPAGRRAAHRARRQRGERDGQLTRTKEAP